MIRRERCQEAGHEYRFSWLLCWRGSADREIEHRIRSIVRWNAVAISSGPTKNVDGEYQDFKSKNGAYVRQQFFNKYPETAALVKDMSDDEIWSLRRGGHDPEKVYAAYAAALKHTGQPTVILAKTVKGYGMGRRVWLPN